MRHFLTYFNALLLGVILGMIVLAVAHAIPITSAARTSHSENARTIAVPMSLVKSACQASYGFRRWQSELLSDR